MKLFKLLRTKVLLANIIIFIFFSVAISYLSVKLPEHIYFYKRWIFRERKWEKAGALYERLFRVRSWKALLPEVSDFFNFSFPKKYFTQSNREYMSKYLMESCRSELTHWNIIFSSLLFILWCDPSTTLKIIIIAISLNLPYIIIQRYNRPRIIRLLAKKGEAKEYVLAERMN